MTDLEDKEGYDLVKDLVVPNIDTETKEADQSSIVIT
jgi:hypothetical protein